MGYGEERLEYASKHHVWKRTPEDEESYAYYVKRFEANKLYYCNESSKYYGLSGESALSFEDFIEKFGKEYSNVTCVDLFSEINPVTPKLTKWFEAMEYQGLFYANGKQITCNKREGYLSDKTRNRIELPEVLVILNSCELPLRIESKDRYSDGLYSIPNFLESSRIYGYVSNKEWSVGGIVDGIEYMTEVSE